MDLDAALKKKRHPCFFFCGGALNTYKLPSKWGHLHSRMVWTLDIMINDNHKWVAMYIYTHINSNSPPVFHACFQTTVFFFASKRSDWCNALKGIMAWRTTSSLGSQIYHTLQATTCRLQVAACIAKDPWCAPLSQSCAYNLVQGQNKTSFKKVTHLATRRGLSVMIVVMQWSCNLSRLVDALVLGGVLIPTPLPKVRIVNCYHLETILLIFEETHHI